MIALIDNYDSFTFNVEHYVRKHKAVQVLKNTDPLAELIRLPLQGLPSSASAWACRPLRMPSDRRSDGHDE